MTHCGKPQRPQPTQHNAMWSLALKEGSHFNKLGAYSDLRVTVPLVSVLLCNTGERHCVQGSTTRRLYGVGLMSVGPFWPQKFSNIVLALDLAR